MLFRKWKGKLHTGRKASANHIANKDLYPDYIKNSYNSNSVTRQTMDTMSRRFQWAWAKKMYTCKDAQHHQSWKYKLKPIMRLHYTPLEWLKLIRLTLLHFWETVWQFLLQHNPAFSLIGIYPREIKSCAHKNTCIWIFTATL